MRPLTLKTYVNQLAPTRIPSPKRSPGKKTVSQRLALSDDLGDLAQIDLGIAPTPTRRLQIFNQSEVSVVNAFFCVDTLFYWLSHLLV